MGLELTVVIQLQSSLMEISVDHRAQALLTRIDHQAILLALLDQTGLLKSILRTT